MKPIAWRQLQEASADMAKALGNYYKDLRKNGFSRRQALELVKAFFLQSFMATTMSQESD